jgi:hypothetical protein
MTYYTTANSGFTGTGNYYNYYDRYGSTGAYSSGDYFDYSSTTTSTQTPYTQTCADIPYIAIQCPKEVEHKPSEQELLRQREERVKAEEAAKNAKAEVAEAEGKARLLLLEYLDNENKQRLLDRKPLEVPSRLFGDIKYHIPISNGRIKAWKENKVITELCLAVRESGCLPTDDIVLTKLLHVLHDEENMLRTANHFDIKENLLTRLN